jgi:membrane protease YdiL (CAAX protease family)
MKNANLIRFLIILVVLLVVCMTLFTPISPNLKLGVRIALTAMFFISWRIFAAKGMIHYRDLSFALFALNLSFLLAMPFTASFWNLNAGTSKGISLLKLSDSGIISGALIISFLVAGYSLKSIFIRKGRLLAGIITGIVFFILLGYLALNNPQQRPVPGFLQKNIAWILIFVLANGFMEELIFRGIFLEKLNTFFKPFWSILLTSVCFAVPHLAVNYQSDTLLFSGIVFLLGMICGYAMYLTRSIIAPALIHAGADLMIIIPIFAAYGAA